MTGNADASTTLRPLTPFTRKSESSTYNELHEGFENQIRKLNKVSNNQFN